MVISCAKRDVVRRQHLCGAVFLNAVRYRALVETQIDEMGLGVVFDHKLRKAVRVGIFQNQQLAPVAGNHSGGLVGIQECSVLFFAEIFPLVMLSVT